MNHDYNNSNNNNRTTRNNSNRTNNNTYRHPNHNARRQNTSRSNSNNKNNKNTTFKAPEWANKELGDHIFITGPNAPTKYTKTKAAIINHITKEMKNAEAIKWAMKNEAEYDFTLEAPSTRDNEGNPISIDVTTAEGYQLKLQINQHHKDKQLYKSNKTTAYGYIIGQCTQSMKNELEAREDWKTIEDDMIGTLKAIKEISCNHQTSKYYIGTLLKVIRDYFTIKQEENESSVLFAKRFKTCQDLMEDRFGKIDMEEAMKTTPEYIKLCDKKGDLLAANEQEAAELVSNAYKRLQGYNYICASTLDKAKQMCKELSNQYAMGEDKYPTNLDQAVAMLN